MQKLTDGAAKAFSDARQAHLFMESGIFIPAMDFEKLDRMTVQLTENLGFML